MRTRNPYNRFRAHLIRGNEKVESFLCNVESGQEAIDNAFNQPSSESNAVIKTITNFEIKVDDRIKLEGIEGRKRILSARGEPVKNRNTRRGVVTWEWTLETS